MLVQRATKNYYHHYHRHYIVHEVHKLEAKLPQTDRATRYVSKFVLCFTSYWSYKGFKQQK